MSRINKKEAQDTLGFTASNYYDMQKLVDQNGKQGDALRDGWDVTAEQITLINSPAHPLHKVSVIAFYDVNFKRLCRLSFNFIMYRQRFKKGALLTVVNQEDLLQQVFCDLLGGWLKLPHDTKRIKSAICRCFTYAAVGGLEGVEDVKEFRAL